MAEPLLVTFVQAKQHLGITTEEPYVLNDVHHKLELASAIILDYLADKADPRWTQHPEPIGVPKPVQTATLYMLTHLNENRGDDMEADREVWEAIRRVLERHHQSALA